MPHIQGSASVPYAPTTPIANAPGPTPLHTPDVVRFSGNRTQDTEQLGLAKSMVKRGSSAMLGLIPDSIYRRLERKRLYKGADRPELRCNLQALKQSAALNAEPQSILANIEEVRFQSGNHTENLGWYHPAQDGKPTLLFSLGNNMSMEAMLGYEKLMKAGYGFMTYQYPGFGNTPGTPNEAALYQSLEAATRFLEEEKGVPKSNQILYGISLGGAITAEIASKYRYKAVILQSTMTCFSDVVQNMVEQRFHLPSWLLPLHEHLQSKLDSISKMPRIKSPLLILHGTEDPLMPPDYAKRLWEKAGTPLALKSQKEFTAKHTIDPSVSTEPIQAFLQTL